MGMFSFRRANAAAEEAAEGQFPRSELRSRRSKVWGRAIRTRGKPGPDRSSGRVGVRRGMAYQETASTQFAKPR